MASLVEMDARHLKITKSLDIPDRENLRVLSILGKARMGKSTFLNAIASRLTAVKAPFETRDDEHHCTHGVNYYYCKDQNLLLLDSQGLALEDSSHEPTLLLFLYLVSDIVIVNERMMLQNEALKLMEPICAFMTLFEIDESKKPKLVFRISDADMVTDIEGNLEKVMKSYNDQYQSIRESIQQLFQPDITIVKTDTPDKKTKLAISNGNYASLFEDVTMGFQYAIEKVLSLLPVGTNSTEWKGTIYTIADKINRNEKITLDKLDVVSQTAKTELIAWEAALSNEYVADIQIRDGHHTTYQTLVEPRETLFIEKVEEFRKRFSTVAEALKGPALKSIKERIHKPIENAKLKLMNLADTEIQNYYASLKPAVFELSNDTQSFGKRDMSLFTNQLGYSTIKAAIAHLYQPVRAKYETAMIDMERTLIEHVHGCKVKESTYMDLIKHEMLQNLLDATKSLHDECASLTEIETFQDMYDLHSFSESPVKKKIRIHEQSPKSSELKLVSMLFLPVTAILKELYSYRISKLLERINELFEVAVFQVTATPTTIGIERQLVNATLDGTYDLLVEPYNHYVTSLVHNDERNMTLAGVLKERKETLVFRKTYHVCDVISRISDVKFVKIHKIFISYKTFIKDYQPLFTQVIDRLFEKKYIATRKDIQMDFVFYNKEHETGTFKRPNITAVAVKARNQYILRLFYHMRDKVFARAVAETAILPVTSFKEML